MYQLAARMDVKSQQNASFQFLAILDNVSYCHEYDKLRLFETFNLELFTTQPGELSTLRK